MARLVLFSFLLTFIASRIMVYLIMINSSKYAQKRLGPLFEQLEAGKPK